MLLLCVAAVQAQRPIVSFFDAKGAVNFKTQEIDHETDTLKPIVHRVDDVVWFRTVYRVIDMRYKQNYQLYFPVSPSNPTYRSLFKVMVDAIINGMPVYGKPDFDIDITPHFEAEPLAKAEVASLLNTDMDGVGDGNIATSEYMIINYDSVRDKMSFNNYSYEGFVKNQLKWMIQEVVFFDKHYSRLFTKIVGIAPMSSAHAGNEDTPLTEALYQSILFWVAFDDFRPYLQKQNIIPQANDNSRTTFDQFFAERRYSSYLIGDANMYSRMFSDFAVRGRASDVLTDRIKMEKDIKREQERIQNELLNFELDLWEY